MTTAEDLIRTDSERAALEKLREITGETGGPMERHGLRVFLIADRLATAREAQVDREVLLIAGLLHDIGLYDEASHGGVYVREGAEFTADLLRAQGWDEEPDPALLRRDRAAPRASLPMGARRGGRADPSRRPGRPHLGLVRFGLSREWLHDLFESVPRDGTYGTIGREVGKQLLHRPLKFARSSGADSASFA